MTTQTQTLTVDGITYAVDQFSQQVQSGVQMYSAFQADLQKAQLEVAKTQAAMAMLSGQIQEAVKAELAAKAADAKAAAEPQQE